MSRNRKKKKDRSFVALPAEKLEHVERRFCDCRKRKLAWRDTEDREFPATAAPEQPFGCLLFRILKQIRQDTEVNFYNSVSEVRPGQFGTYQTFTRFLKGGVQGNRKINWKQACSDALWVLLLGEGFEKRRLLTHRREVQLANRIHRFFVREDDRETELPFFLPDRRKFREPRSFAEALGELLQLKHRVARGRARFVQVCSMHPFLDREDRGFQDASRLLREIANECGVAGVDVVLVAPARPPAESLAKTSAQRITRDYPRIRRQFLEPMTHRDQRYGYEYFSSMHRFSLLEYEDFSDPRRSFRHMVVRRPGGGSGEFGRGPADAEVRRFSEWVDRFVPEPTREERPGAGQSNDE